MYICKKCKNTFEEPRKGRSFLAECWGRDVYEDYTECPHCKSENFEEAVICEKCGEYRLPEELEEGICDDCIDGYRKDFATVYEIAEKADIKTDIQVNAVITSLLTEAEINKILFEHLNAKNEVDCSKFIDEDYQWFAEKIAIKLKEGNNTNG